jgi:hypothetical protein
MKQLITAFIFYMILAGNLYPQVVAPLSIGNSWVYYKTGNSGPALKYTITAMERINNNDYYLCKSNDEYYPVQYFRLRDDSLYIRFISQQEVPYYKHRAVKRDTFIYKTWFGKLKFKVEEITNKEVMNKNVTVKELSVDLFFDRYSEQWTDELGLISRRSFSGKESYILKGCVINGVLYGDTTGTVTGVEEENVIKNNYQLAQNYPNPFNPETRISYKLAEAGYVSLKVFDILGKEVAVLVDEYKNPGYYTIGFNAQNYGLTSGIYFYRLRSGSFIETKKLVLMR